jgi:hypothetical protein
VIKLALIYPGSHSSSGNNLTRECSSKKWRKNINFFYEIEDNFYKICKIGCATVQSDNDLYPVKRELDDICIMPKNF